MNNETPEKKNSLLKTLAIAGFVAIIIIIGWLSIQFVSVIPNAFSSLASLAEGINQYEETTEGSQETQSLVVTSNTTLVNSGGSADISWNTAQAQGSYVFSYDCADGVAVDLVGANGVQNIDCDSNYNVGDVDTLTLAIDSEKNRYSDLSYTIAFIETDKTEPTAVGNAALTIVNSNVANINLADETEEEILEEAFEDSELDEIAQEAVDETPESAPSNPSTVTQPPAPVFEQEYVYTIPTSDPNGRIDLASRFISTGVIINQRFVSTSINRSQSGAIQFEVKNLGTKTSEDWTFSFDLPTGGTYESKVQKPLKPNERAILTVGFPEANRGSFTFEVDVETSQDRVSANNDFETFVIFTN